MYIILIFGRIKICRLANILLFLRKGAIRSEKPVYYQKMNCFTFYEHARFNMEEHVETKCRVQRFWSCKFSQNTHNVESSYYK